MTTEVLSIQVVEIDPVTMDPLEIAAWLIDQAAEAEVFVTFQPVDDQDQAAAEENLWLLDSLVNGEWTAAHTDRNSIEPVRLSRSLHPVRVATPLAG